MQSRHWILIAGISTFIAVALGAFGAHALEALLTERGLTATWETASRCHFYPAKIWGSVGFCFLIGTLFFSGSLYILCLSGVRILGAITPIGGVFFLIGWVLLAIAGWRKAVAH